MIKLNKQVASLEDVLTKIEMQIEELEDKKQEIIDNACYSEREMTKAEEKKIDTIDEKIESLNEEADAVQNAIDYLSDYVD